jgi:hypothetical protein
MGIEKEVPMRVSRLATILICLFLCISLVGCDSDSPTSPRARLVYVALGASDAFGMDYVRMLNRWIYTI